eukprot:gnl/Hemi2/17949_TR5922_c0_g1_i1.p2 gnl/Hemi2/17949_TR5922_c0_g1~~gnl/Hemi2/17949_TR5922_c0_g1_i1.p2  ORF type:complete len:222 (+),score=49.38 gnl/Hemi2/17949_TR5922_c0_g1_i1:112-777(+)
MFELLSCYDDDDLPPDTPPVAKRTPRSHSPPPAGGDRNITEGAVGCGASADSEDSYDLDDDARHISRRPGDDAERAAGPGAPASSDQDSGGDEGAPSGSGAGSGGQLPLCNVCLVRTARYRCPVPLCQCRSCSLPCTRQHKQDTGCTGMRDRTGAVAIAHYDMDQLMHDYRLLEEISAVVKDSKQRRLSAPSQHGRAPTARGGGKQRPWRGRRRRGNPARE